MEFRVLTLRYSAELGAIDETDLVTLSKNREVFGIREHFFMVHEVPHLLCIVRCRPQATRPAIPPEVETNRGDVAADSSASTSTPPSDPCAGLTPKQQRLFEIIRRWRWQTAQRDGVPPYVVLTNRNLDALVRTRPNSLTALRQVRGIGKAKVERHGKSLLALLADESGPSPKPGAEPHASATSTTPRQVTDIDGDPAGPKPMPDEQATSTATTTADINGDPPTPEANA